jgi:thiol-disulfide isomerase/thioredoxin
MSPILIKHAICLGFLQFLITFNAIAVSSIATIALRLEGRFEGSIQIIAYSTSSFDYETLIHREVNAADSILILGISVSRTKKTYLKMEPTGNGSDTTLYVPLVVSPNDTCKVSVLRNKQVVFSGRNSGLNSALFKIQSSTVPEQLIIHHTSNQAEYIRSGNPDYLSKFGVISSGLVNEISKDPSLDFAERTALIRYVDVWRMVDSTYYSFPKYANSFEVTTGNKAFQDISSSFKIDSSLFMLSPELYSLSLYSILGYIDGHFFNVSDAKNPNKYLTNFSKKYSEFVKASSLREEYRTDILSWLIDMQTKSISVSYTHLASLLNSDFILNNGIQRREVWYERLEKKRSLQKGNFMRDIEARDLDGNIKRLSSLVGKIIYLDVWATWCQPCIEEMKHSIKLSHDPKYSDVLFVYLSIDSNPDRWRQFLQDNPDLIGVHLNQGPEFEKEKSVYDIYDLNGIPFYLLLDRRGVILQYPADRPSWIDLDDYMRK